MTIVSFFIHKFYEIRAANDRTMNKFHSFLVSLLIVLSSCSSDSEDPVPEPDSTPPQMDFSIAGFPNTDDAPPIVVSNQIKITVDAQDANGIAKIEAFIDNQKVAEDTTAPYELIIDISSYTSKSKTGKFTDYTLRIDATDTSGNVTSKEQVINIDNELPTISQVSLEEGTIIGGEVNSVTFTVSDNEDLKEVKTYLNNELLAEITDEKFEINIDTQQLEDGENSLKIEAIDLAENTAFFEVAFISDNTGPVISIPNLVNGQIIDDNLIISPEVQDEFSQVVSFMAKLNDEIILESTTFEIGEYELVSESIPVGPVTFDIIAVDALGNESALSIDSEILRLLIKVLIPQDFLSPFWGSFWVFASEMDGAPIVAYPAKSEDTEIRLYAPGEFDLNKPYMLTLLAEDTSFSDSFNRITNIQGLTRTNLPELNLSLPTRRTVKSSNSNPMTGFEIDEFVQGDGFDYAFSHYPDQQSSNFEVYSLNNSESTSSSYYIYSTTLKSAPYAFLKSEAPFENGLEISDFETDTNIQSGVFDIIGTRSGPNIQLQILGYETSMDFENGVYHELFRGAPEFVFGGVHEYYLNSSFTNYSHQLVIGNYLTNRTGMPANEYTLTDWNVDYQQSGRNITITKSGIDHVLGRIRLSPADGLGGDYSMVVLFDSENTDVVTLPEIPEEMKDMSIYNVAKNKGFDFEQVHITSFDNISSYEEYLDQIIKNNIDPKVFSNIIETEMKSTSDSGTPFKSFNFE